MNLPANPNSPRASFHAPAEFHLIPEALPFADSPAKPGAATATSPGPIVIPAGVTCLLHDGSGPAQLTACPSVPAPGQFARHARPGTAGAVANSSSDDDCVNAPRFEPLSGRGPLPRLLMVNPAGHTTRVNGLPAARVSLLSTNDRLQFGDSCQFSIALYHRPRVGPVPLELIGTRCPVCTIPLTAEEHCLVCGCGAPLHAATEENTGTALDCARLASECPRCQQRVRFVPSYEPADALSAAHD